MSLYRVYFGTQSMYIVAISMASAIKIAEDRNLQLFQRGHVTRTERLGDVHVEPGCY